MAQNIPRGTPGRVMVILTLLTGVVMVSAWRDALNRKTNEWVRHPTALGDTAILQPTHLPALLSTGGKTVSLQAGQTTFHRRDDKMFRVLTGLDAPLPFTLYTASENLAAHAEPKLYARTGPHQYVPLRARLASEGPAPAQPTLPAPGPRKNQGPPGNEAEPFAAAVIPAPPPIPQPPSSPGAAPGPSTPSASASVTPSASKATAAPPKITALPKPTTPPPQVPPGEDPDKALALPASKNSARPPGATAPAPPPAPPAAQPVAQPVAPTANLPAAVPPAPIALPRTAKPPIIRRAEPVLEDEPTPPPAAPPKAIPLPPEEQDSPVPAP